MVIYQKQHRLAHRQYCVLLSESRLTRFQPPSKKAFFPSSHISRVNSKCIIKTLFPSKCSSINFGSLGAFKEEGWKAPRTGACHRESRLAPRERSRCRERGKSLLGTAESRERSNLAPLSRSQRHLLQGRWPRHREEAGGGRQHFECSDDFYSHLSQPHGSSYLCPCRVKQRMPGAVLPLL